MPDAFDPYYEWLGIPPKHQPADYFRLLGVDSDESDPKVIEHASKQRLAYLRTLQTGPRAKIANQILNEVVRAKRTLLDPNLRQAYEAKLQSQRPARRMGEGTSRAAESPRNNPGKQEESPHAERPTPGGQRTFTFSSQIRLAILAFAILVAIGIFLFKDPYLKVHVVNESGQPIRAEIPFTELPPEEAKNKNLFPLSFSNGNPAKWLFEEMKDDKNIIRIHDYANWPNQGYPYEIVGPEQHEFDRSKIYFLAPSLTFTLKKVEPIQITGQLKGDFKQRNFAVCLDASGQEISSTVGTTHPLSDARPTGRFQYSKAQENGQFELTDVLLRSGDKPSIKVIEQKGNNFTLIGSQSLGDTGGDIDNLKVMITPRRQRMSIRGKLRVVPPGHSPGGFIVYMDRNKNERPDPGEPQTRTARTGDFNFSFSYFPGAGPELLKIEPQTDNYRKARLESTPQMRVRNNRAEVIDANFAIQRR